MIRNRILPLGLRRDKRAVSPAISSIILTSVIVMILIVTIVYANNYLNARMAENEFSAMKQFMQTVGLQIDDVAWIIGRTQTIRYTSRFGNVNFESLSLNYYVYVNGSSYLANYSTGILLFNMPVTSYSLGSSYQERIFPSSRSFLQIGTSAPISHVFIVEKLPMNDGNFIRLVVAPSIRVLNSTISTGGGTKSYFKFFLPILSSGTHPYRSQSVTLMGKNVLVKTESGVNTVRINVSFPKAFGGLGFDSGFFNFEDTVEEFDVPDGSIIEFYTSEVIVSLGLHA